MKFHFKIKYFNFYQFITKLIICNYHLATEKRRVKYKNKYSAYVSPGVQVFDGFSGQVLFVQLSVDLRELRYPEPVTVLPQDLPNASLHLLRVVGLSFPRAEVFIQIQGGWRNKT